MRAEYERRSQEKKRQREAEAARLRKGPPRGELVRAGNPIAAAQKYLAVAKSARSPEQFRPDLTDQVWEHYQAELSRFDPELAAAALRKVAGRTGDDADLVRRIHENPRTSFLAKHRKIAETIVKVTAPKLNEKNKFQVELTGHLDPTSGTPEELGDLWKLYPFGAVKMLLVNGRWRVIDCSYSMSVERRRYRWTAAVPLTAAAFHG